MTGETQLRGLSINILTCLWVNVPFHKFPVSGDLSRSQLARNTEILQRTFRNAHVAHLIYLRLPLIIESEGIPINPMTRSNSSDAGMPTFHLETIVEKHWHKYSWIENLLRGHEKSTVPCFRQIPTVRTMIQWFSCPIPQCRGQRFRLSVDLQRWTFWISCRWF